MARIERLELTPTVVFEGFDPPSNLLQIIRSQFAELPTAEKSEFIRLHKEKKRHYRVQMGLSLDAASNALLDDLLSDLEFAREDGELEFQCANLNNASILRYLTGYRMRNEQTGWLFRNHFAVKTAADCYCLLLPKD